MQKKRMLFDVNISGDWIGGIYYVRNIVFQMVNSPDIIERCVPVIVCSDDYYGLFKEFSGCAEIITYTKGSKIGRLKAVMKGIRKSDWIYRYSRYKFDPLNLLEKKAIYWIPDFQEIHYPEFFPAEEVEKRKEVSKRIAVSGRPLVLSSEDSYRDFSENYDKNRKGRYIVHFVSAIEQELAAVTEEKCRETLEKYNLTGKRFVLVANQFWQHKNHMVVFRAIAELYKKNKESDILFVFTGAKKDYRNEEYFDNLMKIVEENHIENLVSLLGFIDRTEQLSLMKCSEYIIQPSLFEGWGTVVEDAKVLDKTILLSDIPIHREQKSGKCILFEAVNPSDLACRIEEESKKQHNDSMDRGIADMKSRAREYAESMKEMIEDLSK
ncbi:MAG: glycosyltransferase [Lachnospiraceae bacterium]|nr:glycosyltransferase [Lachnospiraceae bacterium]